MEKVKLCGKVVGVNDGNIFVDGVPLSAKNFCVSYVGGLTTREYLLNYSLYSKHFFERMINNNKIHAAIGKSTLFTSVEGTANIKGVIPNLAQIMLIDRMYIMFKVGRQGLNVYISYDHKTWHIIDTLVRGLIGQVSVAQYDDRLMLWFSKYDIHRDFRDLKNEKTWGIYNVRIEIEDLLNALRQF